MAACRSGAPFQSGTLYARVYRDNWLIINAMVAATRQFDVNNVPTFAQDSRDQTRDVDWLVYDHLK